MQGPARQQLNAKLARGDDWAALRLDGVIDEHNGLDGLVAELGPPCPLLLVDLGGVRRINSVGVRDWVAWLRALRERFGTVVLVDCTPAIMNEVNLVRNFARGTVITSFQAPYYCDRCGREAVETLDALAMLEAGARHAPAAPCGKPACANALDDADDNYFAFLDDLAEVTLPDHFDARLRSALTALAAATQAVAATGPTPAPDASPRPAGLALRHAPDAPAPAALGAIAPPPASTTTGRVDFVFVATLLAMLAVLGVLIYLITTLE